MPSGGGYSINADAMEQIANLMGLASAHAFAEARAAVTLVNIHKAALDKAMIEITATDGSAIGVICDVRGDARVAAIIERTAAKFDRITAINLRSVWACMKHDLIQMTKQGGRAIVNNSSVSGIRVNAIYPGETETPTVAKMVEEGMLTAAELTDSPLGHAHVVSGGSMV